MKKDEILEQKLDELYELESRELERIRKLANALTEEEILKILDLDKEEE